MSTIKSFPPIFTRVALDNRVDASLEAKDRAAKVALVDKLRANKLPLLTACVLAGVSRSTYYRWRRIFFDRGLVALRDGRVGNRRRRVPPVQQRIRGAVFALREQFPYYGKHKIHYELLQAGLVCSVSSVGRVISNLIARGAILPVGYSRKASAVRRSSAKRAHAKRLARRRVPTLPGELVQVDTMFEYSLLRRRVHFSAIDPVTKVVAASLCGSATSTAAKEFLLHLQEVFPYPVRGIQVDNGSEYKGFFEAACVELGIDLFTIPPRSPKWNAHVERLQRTFRDEHYAFEPFTETNAEANVALQAYVYHYNHRRPHTSLGFIPPMSYTVGRNFQASQLT